MSKIGLDRIVLARIADNNVEAIKALEKVFYDVNVAMPDQIAAAINQAAQAVAAANQALGVLAGVVDGLQYLLNMPAAAPVPEYEDTLPASVPAIEYEDMRPAIQLGSISIQEADNVDITGGTIGLSAGAVGAPSFYLVDRTTGLYRIGANNWGYSVAGTKLLDFAATLLTVTGSVSATSQLRSTVATGTAPLAITSTTKVANLNVDLLDGTDWTAPGTIGGVTPGSANFTTINASGQITSTVGGGTAPFVVASSTVVGNLNVSQLLGGTWAIPGAIGATTRNTGAFTTLSTTGAASIGNGTAAVSAGINGLNSGVGGGSSCVVSNAGVPVIAIGNRSAIFGGAYDASPVIYCPTGPVRINVGVQADIGFGCNGKTPQTAAASGGAMATTAATNAAPYGFTTAAQADSIAVKLNAIQAALIANGIMS